mmetsp:Transcript_57316/g.136243  ORF Transcript_57316/g.136243 Transcript_57316/m.136243 type:complete len:300 (-) Transcript_57316:192-1091(-)
MPAARVWLEEDSGVSGQDDDVSLNTVNVTLPPGLSEEEANQLLWRHGEVAEAMPVYGQANQWSVTYYDVRAARSIHEELGEEAVDYVEQTGNRTVHLPGNAELDGSLTEGVSNIYFDEQGGFAVEFFDVRIAAHVREIYLDQDKEDQDEGAAVQSVQSEMPLKAVLVKGMPNELLTHGTLQAILEQAGLDKDVLECRCREGQTTGEVLLQVRTWDAANSCIAHFDGCQWDKSGTNVSARVVPMQEVIAESPSAHLRKAAVKKAAGSQHNIKNTRRQTRPMKISATAAPHRKFGAHRAVL